MLVPRASWVRVNHPFTSDATIELDVSGGAYFMGSVGRRCCVLAAVEQVLVAAINAVA
jgi:hypothetical protein